MAKQTNTKTRSSAPPPKPRKSAAPSFGSRAPAPASIEPITQVTRKPVPSHEQIARRAFELYQLRPPGAGSALGDWLQAERELAG